ncbi:GGDEF domain-containing response regulator [Desulfotalea psychrophila]|uniref:diguanylate cyclase n=1 Tax=Desulfotalea psychrophila (strain LSv54 / DSM 12343) TaxID=177439 RepID=Q6AMA6_DESPS|nr:diguanylate cyclase [Desulfotalea psychrophila]CAG36519.1 related to two-component system response regulator (hybrid family) [Desulfotalea psychrophila LSv54]
MTQIKILIVDDRPENLLVLESLIDNAEIELVKATSGNAALAATLDHDFALVLLDVQMPGMDGYEVAELMRCNKNTKNIPIIFVTAEHKEKAQIFKGYDSGAVDYLFKPLEPVILKGKIGVFLELYQHKEELEKKSIELDNRLCELEELQQQLEETNEQLTLLSTRDGLTGLLNRRYFDEIYQEELQRSLRLGSELSLLLIDVDNFKAYNDSFGHLVGDNALKAVANALCKSVKRHVDRVARYGGEEFVVILPDTDLKGAEHVAERMRNEVLGLQVSHPRNKPQGLLTISLGVSSVIPKADIELNTLLSVADARLYAAKNAGRNCWRSAIDLPMLAETLP